MADIFISYSKADRDLALKLSAFLEAEGWSVWWDTSLGAGDTYRDEIMKELMAARAVISIWTENSIKSDWVRAEAGRAKAEGKLIPVKASGLTYADIPLPFGEMHTEDIANPSLIRAAVVAQLSKPQVEPSALWLTTRGFRLQLLTWAGIIGGSITVFTNLRGILGLADWARWIVTHWQAWMQGFWQTTLGWIGVHVDPLFTPTLSFAAFLAMTAIGTLLRSKGAVPGRSTAGKLKFFAIALAVYAVWLVGMSYLTLVVFRGEAADPALQGLKVALVALFVATAPMVVLIWASRERLHCLVMLVFLIAFWIVLLLVPLFSRMADLVLGGSGSEADRLMGAALLASIFILPLAAIGLAAFVPLKAINQRLLFLFLGALSLVALNKISVLGLQHFLEAPK